MQIKFEETVGASDQSLIELRDFFQNVPSSFERFLSKHDGARSDAYFPKHEAPDVLGSSLPIVRLVKADRIVSLARNHASLKKDYIPIGDDGGGNYMCISVTDGSVQYLDYDWYEFHLLSSSFDAWLKTLVPV